MTQYPRSCTIQTMERTKLSPEFIHSKHLRLGFLASHNGTSMQAVLGAIQDGRLNATPEVIMSNNSKSVALKIAEMLEIPKKHISQVTHPDLTDEAIHETLLQHGVDLVVCSGWNKMVGEKTLRAFPNKIINIHPAIHEEYRGGSWMDMAVHRAVVADGKKTSGYTIHLMTDEVDQGEVLATGVLRVSPIDTPETLQTKVKFAEGQGIVGLLQDISLGHIKLPGFNLSLTASSLYFQLVPQRTDE